jgi:ankyrin repeat protein
MPKHFRKSAAIGDIETCRELLKTKPSLVDMPGPDSGKTALHWAAEKGQVDMVYFLLEHKASLLEDNHGLTAYDVSKVPEIRRLLSYHFKDYFMNQAIKHTPITEKEAIQYGFKLPEEVLEDFWDVLQSKSLVDFHEMLKYHHLSVNNYMNGMPMMMILICVENIDPHKNIAFIDYFIEHKVDLNLKAHPRQYDAYEGTVLHSLLANENIKTTLYILQKAREEGLSINPTIRDVEGKTIVLIGALLRDTKFVSACLEQFGNSAIDIPDDMGRTPLHYAYLFGDKPMVDLLLRHGAHSECLDKNNKRPIDMLDENQQALLASFRKFHINAATRLVSDNLTLLEKCMSDRKELRHIVEQEPYLSSQKKSPN